MKTYDVIIGGAGVSGLAAAFMFKYTNVRRIAVIEKYPRPAMVNSDPSNNAQTRHDGSTETNYPPAHTLEVRDAAIVMDHYILSKNVPGLYRQTTRMAFASTAVHCALLRERFRLIGKYYPDLRLVEGAEEIRKIEPLIMSGRDPSEEVCALVTDKGYAINYQILAECFLEDARKDNPDLDVFFNTEIKHVEIVGEYKVLTMKSGERMRAKVVLFALGAFSLLFAQQLGFGMNYAIAPISADFWKITRTINGKVYPPQDEGMAFAEVHADPDVRPPFGTRMGPTTKPLPLLERHNFWSMIDFFRYPIATTRGIRTLYRIFKRKGLLTYVLQNYAYTIPLLGKWLFLVQKARKLVPDLTWRELTKIKGAGGVRPQVLNLDTLEMEMGDKTLVEGGCIFNSTPSPGASKSPINGLRDVKTSVRLLGPDFWFDEERALRDFGLKNLDAVAA